MTTKTKVSLALVVSAIAFLLSLALGITTITLEPPGTIHAVHDGGTSSEGKTPRIIEYKPLLRSSGD